MTYFDSCDSDSYYDDDNFCDTCQEYVYNLKDHLRSVVKSANVDHLHFLFSSQKVQGTCMCIDCGNTFMSVKSLLQHVGGKARHDDDHNVLFNKVVQSYYKHMAQQTSEAEFVDDAKTIMIDKPASCFACNEYFDREYCLNEHLIFKIRRSHFDHMSSIYENQPNICSFSCCVCGNDYNNLKQLLQHIGHRSDFCSSHKSLFKDIFLYFKRRCYNIQVFTLRDTFKWIQELYLDVIKIPEACCCCHGYYDNIRDHIEDMLRNANTDHLALVNNAFRVVSYACKACGNSFGSLKSLIQHIGGKRDHQWLFTDIVNEFMAQSFYGDTDKVLTMPAWRKKFYTQTLSLVLQETTVTQLRPIIRRIPSSTANVSSFTSAATRVPTTSASGPSASAAPSSTSSDGNCSICLVKKCDHVALPCGHITFCENCVDSYGRRGLPCPLCRTHINSFHKVYLPA